MRNAPSVLYPVGRCAWYVRGLYLLGFLGLLTVAGAWWTGARQPGLTGLPWTGAGLWVLWGGFALWSWQRTPQGLLKWDASTPAMDAAASPGAWIWYSEAYQDGVKLLRVDRVLDVQNRVLLHLRYPHEGRSWVWAERARDPARWADFRRALLAHQRRAAFPG